MRPGCIIQCSSRGPHCSSLGRPSTYTPIWFCKGFANQERPTITRYLLVISCIQSRVYSDYSPCMPLPCMHARACTQVACSSMFLPQTTLGRRWSGQAMHWRLYRCLQWPLQYTMASTLEATPICSMSEYALNVFRIYIYMCILFPPHSHLSRAAPI